MGRPQSKPRIARGISCEKCGVDSWLAKDNGWDCSPCRSRYSRARHILLCGPDIKRRENNPTTCARCGEPLGKCKSWCQTCRNKWRESRWRQVKWEEIQRRGSQCSSCGWMPKEPKECAAMDFHHISPDKKEYTPSDLWLAKKERREAELAKCILLCANCHRIHHAEDWDESLLSGPSKLWRLEISPSQLACAN